MVQVSGLMLSGVVLSLDVFFWRGSSVVHIIREELNAVYALFGLIDYGPFEGIKRDLAFWD